jgi:hypothetical protein
VETEVSRFGYRECENGSKWAMLKNQPYVDISAQRAKKSRGRIVGHRSDFVGI